MKLLGVFIFIVLVFSPLLLTDEEARCDEIPSTFEASHDAKWLKLLHYTKSGSNYKSDAISPSFYLSPEGRTDPEAELVAMLAELKRAPDEIRSDKSPVCKFPARTLWLSRQFHITAPRGDCREFERFKNSLSARAASLVFSSYYLNNPSSAFGHTFLRLERGDPESAAADRNELLDYGINYAADETSSNAVIYALSGALGWFHGSFTKLPFYYKVREYSDFEARDLWFYRLNLSQAQVDELVRHIWELGQTQFDYYFFSTNCSYQIMAVLEAVEPSWRLIERLDHIVIPAETVRVLWDTPNLVRKVDYRASNRKTFETRYHTLSAEETQIFKTLVERKSPDALPTDLPAQTKRKVLDAAVDYYDFAYAKDVLKGDSIHGGERQNFLVARSSLGGVSPEMKVETPVDKEPHLGHRSSRAGLTAGYGTDLKSFTELSYRGAFHDLLDPQAGYPDYAEIQIMDFSVRAYQDPFKIRLEKAALVENSSLTPILAYSYPLSWRMNAGMYRLKEKVCPDCVAGQLLVAGGATVELKHDFLYFYFLFNTQGTWATSFANSKLRLGLGPTGGFRIQLARGLAAISEVTYLNFLWFNPRNLISERTEMRYSIGSNHAVGAHYALSDLETEAGASYYFYF